MKVLQKWIVWICARFALGLDAGMLEGHSQSLSQLRKKLSSGNSGAERAFFFLGEFRDCSAWKG